jgi:Protein of unknown function (DUF3431)
MNIEFELVIARYNEPLLWLLEPPFDKIPNTIYNKGNNNQFLINEHNKGVINLPNMGRESESYLQHVIRRYDSLAKVTLFLPGSLDSNGNKFRKAVYILTHLVSASTFIGIYHQPSIKDDLYEFTLDEWSSRTGENAKKNPEAKLTPSAIRPYGKWYQHHFKDLITHVAPYGGVFSVYYKDIRQHPIERYKTLIQDLQVSSNPETGHYFERSWEAVFGPLNKNKVYIPSLY